MGGGYNTGIYEEIHPADLEVATSVINIAELADPATAANILSNNDGLIEQVGTMNGCEFMDAWVRFVTDNGLTSATKKFNNGTLEDKKWVLSALGSNPILTDGD